MSRILLHPIAPLTAFSLGTAAIWILGTYQGRSIHPAAELVCSFGLTLLTIVWVESDARRRRITPCFDFGTIVALFIPISFAWYCFWSRGIRGLLYIGLLIVLWMIPSFWANVAWEILNGVARP